MNKTLISLLFAAATLPAMGQENQRMKTMDLTAAEMAHYMAPGWNLGNTLEAGSNANNFTNNGGLSAETSWQGTKTTAELLKLLKDKGFNSVRLPVAWVMGHLTDANAMTIDEKWVDRVKEVIDYALGAGLYVVINDHWDGGWLEFDGFTTGADVAEKKEQLRKLWTNIATALADYDERVIFAGLNEPGVGSASPEAKGSLMTSDDAKTLPAFVDRLIEYEQVFIDAVRATDGNNAQRVLVVQGPKTDASPTVTYFDPTRLVDSAKGRLMVEIHHYAPYQFCGMTSDADWGKMWYYWYGHTPARVSSDRYASQAQTTAIRNNMQKMKTNFVDKGYPVIIGEYGANHRSLTTAQGTQAKHDESLQYWYEISTQYSYEAGLIPYAWDTNNLSRPNMTVFGRAALSVHDQNIYDGIMAGDKAGRSAFNSIYPEPSQTSGIAAVELRADDQAAPVYDLSGRQVAAPTTSLANVELAPGIYVFKGKKIVVK